MSAQDLSALIAGGESDRVEFKEKLTGQAPTGIRQAICAFANDLPNHREPGFVFVGIKDDGTPSGHAVHDQLLLQLSDMKTDGNIVPPPSLTVSKQKFQNQDIAVITVQPSVSPPVKYKGRIYIRTGPRRDVANAEDEKILNEKRRYGNLPFDVQPIPSASLSDLRMAYFEYEYLPKAFSRDVLDANDRSPIERLAATKMINSADDPTPTVLGILILGTTSQDFLPGAYIQFLRINGDELDAPVVDDEVISGSIPDQLRRVEEKLQAHNRVAVDFMSLPLEQRTTSYPLEALEQIVRNAVMHRNYENTNAPVRVYWFNNRIEITSPGGSFGSVTEENFGQPGFTDYRNLNLAGVLKELGYVQKFGAGIRIARKQLSDEGYPEPSFRIEGGHAIVTIKTTSTSGRVE